MTPNFSNQFFQQGPNDVQERMGVMSATAQKSSINLIIDHDDNSTWKD